MEAKDRTILEIARGSVSEAQLFDELTRGLASGTISRSRVLRLVGAAILGGTGLLSLFPGVAEARTGSRCRGKKAVNNRSCSGIGCGKRGCGCARSVSGVKRCVNFIDETCPGPQSECDSNQDCPTGEICIEIGGCCGGTPLNICMRPCS